VIPFVDLTFLIFHQGLRDMIYLSFLIFNQGPRDVINLNFFDFSSGATRYGTSEKLSQQKGNTYFTRL